MNCTCSMGTHCENYHKFSCKNKRWNLKEDTYFYLFRLNTFILTILIEHVSSYLMRAKFVEKYLGHSSCFDSFLINSDRYSYLRVAFFCFYLLSINHENNLKTNRLIWRKNYKKIDEYYYLFLSLYSNE